jgi:enoyl-[acyl-carrier protein] reductase I
MSKLDWKSKEGLAVGKGATVQEYVATLDKDTFEIDVAPWGEGHFKVNGKQIAHINDAKDRRQVFGELKTMAERYLNGGSLSLETIRKTPMIPAVKAKLLDGKKGLIIGIANARGRPGGDLSQ